MGAFIPVATAVAADTGATISKPVVWHILGYSFEAGTMIAALIACFAVRWYIVLKDYRVHRWTLDVPVTTLSLMFTAAAVISIRPEPITALMIGTGVGALGAGIIAIAKKYIDKFLPGLSDDAPPQA